MKRKTKYASAPLVTRNPSAGSEPSKKRNPYIESAPK